MKKKGSVCEYSRERDKMLIKAFRTCISESASINLDEIFAEVSRFPAERFYVSELRAMAVIRHHLKKGVWTVRGGRRLEMFRELEARVLNLMGADSELEFEDAVVMAVNSPAPNFYLTPRSCRTLIYNLLKRG